MKKTKTKAATSKTKKTTNNKTSKSTPKSITSKQLWQTIRFKEEELLSERLRKVLNADLLEPIINKCQYPESKDYWRSIFEGHSFRLTPTLAPKLHALCHEVKASLLFDEPVEFFVTNSPTVNAVAYLKNTEDNHHLIVFNSGLIERFNDAELRFVIGHELGHIIYKTAEIKRLIHNIFIDENKIPTPVRNLISLWEKLAEISADRTGFIASPHLESCITNFFKLSSGLNLENICFESGAYLEEIDNILDKYSESDVLFQGSHPTNPIRVKAIQVFSESKTYRSYLKKQQIISDDPELDSKMDELVSLLELHPNNERDHYRALLIVSCGIYLAGIDNEISNEENDKIIQYLSSFTIHPQAYLQAFMDQHPSREDIREAITQAIDRLMRIDPEERYPLFDYLCRMATADKKIKQQEIDFLMKIAVEYLAIHEIEACRMFVSSLHDFQPRL